jgi:multiple sugar transport system permease protein
MHQPTRRAARSVLPRYTVGYFFVAPVMAYLLITGLYPILNVFYMGFSDVVRGDWYFVGFAQFIRAFKDPYIHNALKNTIFFTVASTVLHITIGMGIALLLDEVWFSRRLRNVMRGVLITPWVFSTAASGLMFSLLYHPFGLFNFIALRVFGVENSIEFLANPKLAMWSVIAVNTWKSYPFYMVSILGGLQGIPPELYEAGKVDGAGPWQRFIYITLPQLRPILIAISTIDVISTFGHVDLINMLTLGGPGLSTETIAFRVFKIALLDGNLTYGAAISALLLVLLTTFTFFYLRSFHRRGGESF